MSIQLALWKTTLNSQVNDGSFCTKQQLVFKKRRLVLHKTTACFQKTDESRRRPSNKGKSTYPTLRTERERFEIVKILKSIHLARTRTRAVQRVLSFCCHKCHRLTHNTLIYKQPNKKTTQILTTHQSRCPNFQQTKEKNRLSTPSFLPFFRPTFSPISHQV